MSDETTQAMTLMSDEDGERAFVLVDDAAPSVEIVEAGWREAARREWGIEYAEDPDGIDVRRGWFKTHPHDDECFVECTADDPDRTEEWWSFDLPAEAAVSGGSTP